MKQFKVRLFQDNIYEIIKITIDGWNNIEEKVFQGTLSECEAWLRLTNDGYL